MPTPLRIAVLGDSVTWGQGLLEGQKFYTLVKIALGPSTLCTVVAHSGATIGVNVVNGKGAPGPEVPCSYPTILQQCDAFDEPSDIDVVLINGGVNDIDVRFILNPFTSTADLIDETRQHCYLDMKVLLERTLARFSKPTARFVVTSYYPVLSKQSRPPAMKKFMLTVGMPITPFEKWTKTNPLLRKVVANCAVFAEFSAKGLRQAVAEANAAAGGTARVFFAAPPFSDRNAALAPEAWLFGVKSDYSAEDPVAAERRKQCRRDEKDLIMREQCYRASAGHPNAKGAQEFTRAILSHLV